MGKETGWVSRDGADEYRDGERDGRLIATAWMSTVAGKATEWMGIVAGEGKGGLVASGWMSRGGERDGVGGSVL